jgi:hypothetical protein
MASFPGPGDKVASFFPKENVHDVEKLPLLKRSYENAEMKEVNTGRLLSTLRTPTGIWSLGKTIGTGAMSTVKRAKNLESGEQVL